MPHHHVIIWLSQMSTILTCEHSIPRLRGSELWFTPIPSQTNFKFKLRVVPRSSLTFPQEMIQFIWVPMEVDLYIAWTVGTLSASHSCIYFIPLLRCARVLQLILLSLFHWGLKFLLPVLDVFIIKFRWFPWFHFLFSLFLRVFCCLGCIPMSENRFKAEIIYVKISFLPICIMKIKKP